MKPVFFQTSEDFRRWLEENHETASELAVGFYKVGSGKPSLTWSESVDQALCFGWIDGVRHTIDAESYRIRFTPRRAGSNWSAVNIKKIAELTEKGLMRPAGVRAFENRTEDRSAVYAYENKPEKLPAEYETVFRENEPAWTFFEKQPNGYRRTAMYWVLSAKQEETRRKRLAKLIAESAAGRRV
ncbi:MAG: YdeI/OmpD-associated family protein [Acidobacteria bacterium]|nr:YdeI/OmpD-associated family protein [Acidobacteriota bacterium]